MPEIAGLILAGGKAKRMGGKNKMMLLYEGKPLIDYIVQSMESMKHIYLSVAERKRDRYKKLVEIVDLFPDQGPLGAVLSGLLTCKEPALFVVPCDLFGLNEKLVQKMTALYEKSGQPVFLHGEEGIEPFPGIYTKEMADTMKEMQKRGELKMTSLLQKEKWKKTIQTVEFYGKLWNVNTEEEYGRLRRQQIPKMEVSVEEAIRCIEQEVKEKTDVDSVTIWHAQGRIMGRDETAKVSQPPFPRSPLDGYAVRAEEIRHASKKCPVFLKVIEKIYAGERKMPEAIPGSAVRIMTGAPIPKEYDTIVRQEDTDYGQDKVAVYKSQKPFENYCREGEDFLKGDILLRKGERLDAVRIGIAASAGMAQLYVKKEIKAAVITTGNELYMPGETLPAGGIYDASLFFLVSRLEELGVQTERALHVEDDPLVLAEELSDAVKKADLIITTGGVSVGEKDIVKEALQRVRAKIIFDRIRMKPGAPTVFSVCEGIPVFSLSGNPFGTVVHMELFVRTAIAGLYGCQEMYPQMEYAKLKTGYAKNAPVPRYVRGIAADGYVILPDGKEKPGVLSSASGCSCLVRIEAGEEKKEEGEQVCMIRI